MRKHERCVVCGQPIYYEDATHDQDLCYEINEDYICEDCISGYLEAFCRKELKSE